MEIEKSKKKNKYGAGIIIGTIIVVIVIIALIFLLNGKTTTTGNYPENYSDKSLVCKGDNIDYPIFTYDNSTKKEIEIDLIFSQDKAKSIALTYSLYYNETSSITSSEAHNHAAMNISYGKNGLEADAYNTKYAKLDNRMQMNLYATDKQINNTTLKYFLINSDDNYVPKTLESYKTIYEGKGMKCEETK